MYSSSCSCWYFFCWWFFFFFFRWASNRGGIRRELLFLFVQVNSSRFLQLLLVAPLGLGSHLHLISRRSAYLYVTWGFQLQLVLRCSDCFDTFYFHCRTTSLLVKISRRLMISWTICCNSWWPSLSACVVSFTPWLYPGYPSSCWVGSWTLFHPLYWFRAISCIVQLFRDGRHLCC